MLSTFWQCFPPMVNSQKCLIGKLITIRFKSNVGKLISAKDSDNHGTGMVSYLHANARLKMLFYINYVCRIILSH